MSRSALLAEYVSVLEELDQRDARRKFWHVFPDETHEWRGETYHAREGYRRHLAFIRAGATYRQRCLRAANRAGKTVVGAYEVTAHLTGLYPDWWEGRRFTRPIKAWVAGKSYKTTREILQEQTLLGPIKGSNPKGVAGTEMIPGGLIGRVTWGSGVADLVDTVQVWHASGGWSTLTFKAYEQGRGAFEGTAQDVIWLDEEPPLDVYGECVIRTMTTHGLVYLTFTPLDGMTGTVMQFESEDTVVEPLSLDE